MIELSHNRFDRTNALVAVGVWLTSLTIYSLTVAPTVSLWDCGEFIAACYSLGIPHPPGTPFYVLVGRVASMIPITADISARLNLLSGFCSSVAAMFAYLAAVRLMRHWFKNDNSGYTRLLIYGGAAAGALFLAFGRTNWNNAVEAEVYGMSMMLLMAIVWLTFIHFNHRGTNRGEKALMAAMYLSFLGLGVHMTTFLVVPVGALVFCFKKETPTKYMFLLAGLFLFELYLIFALSSRPNEVPFYVPLTIVFILYVFYILTFEKVPGSLMIIGIGLLISSLPSVAALAGSGQDFWSVIGLVGFLATLGFAIFKAMIYFKKRSSGSPSPGHELIGPMFVLAGALATLILVSNIKGYSVFMSLSAVAVVITAIIVWKYIRLPLFIAVLGTSLIILGVREFFWGTVIAAVAVIVLGLNWKTEGWKTAIVVIVLAAAGYSSHAFIPIRSSLQPRINENNPSQSLDATIAFFERKQYGSESMINRMFSRRAEWLNQFGQHRRMGFYGFFEEQFGQSGRWFLPFLLLGIFGFWEAVRRKPQLGLYLLILALVASVGLVLYMNFADGARQNMVTGRDYLEVRDRDYFFTPAYMLFGLAIGLGITGLIQLLREMTKNYTPLIRKLILMVLPVLFLLPIHAIAGNWYYSERTKNVIAYDYAWNLLQSADPNAILLTAGDNDTFPVWCLQEAYGIRPDVKVVNLSLANTEWYIKQIKTVLGLKLGWTDQEIDELRPFRYPDGRTFRIQDQVIDALVANNTDRPMNYAFTMGPGSRKLLGQNADSLLEACGLKYRLTHEKIGPRVDIDCSMSLFLESDILKYRYWNDPSWYKDEVVHRLIVNTAGNFMRLGEALRINNRPEDAIKVIKFGWEKMPQVDDLAETLAMLYTQNGMVEELTSTDFSSSGLDPKYITALTARAHRAMGNEAIAESILVDLMDQHPDYRRGLDELMTLYIARKDVPAMVDRLKIWLANNPHDPNIAQALRELEGQLETLRPPADDSL